MSKRPNPSQGPNQREHELGAQSMDCMDEVDHARMFAAYREELLKEVVELQLDMHALGDTRMASALKDIIETARGVS
jgi:hypothetical protein